MQSPVELTLRHVRDRAGGGSLPAGVPVTINFHPDTQRSGLTTIELLAREGIYQSQFETGTSNGGMTAYPGGDRWAWESRIFGNAYDDASATLRPKYGALNYRQSEVGGSPRFGSCHLKLYPHVLAQTTFFYPDSYLQPETFGVAERMALIASAEENRLRLEPVLDNYIEAHVHGVLEVERDVEAIVMDPSYQGTAIEEAAHSLRCKVEWYSGFRLLKDRLPDCEKLRGPIAAKGVAMIGDEVVVTPADLGVARDTILDYQTAKWVWHCIARFGRD